jgi:hypothetical protein
MKTKRKKLNPKAKQMHWLLGRSMIPTGSKLHVCRAVLKPLWAYGIQLWATATNSIIEILQCFQFKILRSILHAPWNIKNHRNHEDIEMNTVLSEIKKWNTKYVRKLENHTNAPTVNLLDNNETTHKLKRYAVVTLPNRPQ